VYENVWSFYWDIGIGKLFSKNQKYIRVYLYLKIEFIHISEEAATASNSRSLRTEILIVRYLYIQQLMAMLIVNIYIIAFTMGQQAQAL
jgi:hypothetical protein